MKKLLQITLISTAAFAVLYFGAALTLIHLPEPSFTVAPFPAGETTTADYAPRQFTVRDGETLFARQFPSASEVTILLLHGVTSESAALNVSAQRLRQTTGAEVVALDLRGHGQSGGTTGDVDYIGQYEADVADVIMAIRSDSSNANIILAGHSMGGGIALRFAQLTDVSSVDGYLLFAPHLGTNAPTMHQPDAETAEIAAVYSQLHVPRLIGLGMLNAMGIEAFNQHNTLFFNLTGETTHTYSYRAMVNSFPAEYGAALTAVDAPMLVVVGSEDEAFVVDQFPAAISDYSDGEVHIVAGENHTTIVESATAMTIIERWLSDIQLAANH